MRRDRKSTDVSALLALATIVFAGNSYAQTAVQVLGLPLGGKLPNTVKLCPYDTDKAKEICWVGKPYSDKTGRTLGTVHLPNPDSRVDWAAYAEFKILVDKSNQLLEVTAGANGDEKHKIASSITSRFGLPVRTTLPSPDGGFASWAAQDIFINLSCSRLRCIAAFRTPLVNAEGDSRAEAYRKLQSTRPATP